MLKFEKWLDHEIRFVEIDNEWWAVAKDVADALGYRDAYNMTRMIDEENQGTQNVRRLEGENQGAHKVSGLNSTHKVSSNRGNPNVSVINELGIYEAIFGSQKEEAKEFKKWVFGIIKQLRQQSGLEGFQVFRMMDKEHQKKVMSDIKTGLPGAEKRHYVKANTIANKAVSTKHGYEKMVKKNDMTPEMLVDRQPIVDDTVQLMIANEHFNLDISISKTIYEKHA